MMDEFPCAILANGPAWTKTGVPYQDYKLNSQNKEGRGCSPCNVCIKLGLIASLRRTARAPETPISSAVIGSPCLLVANDHSAQALGHILQTSGQGKDSHTLTSNSDIESSDTLMASFSRVLSNGDLAKIAIVGVEDTVPGNGLDVDIQTRKAGDFLRGQRIRGQSCRCRVS